MIAQIELAGILLVLLYLAVRLSLSYKISVNPPASPGPHIPSGEVELLKMVGNAWVHHGWRHAGHPDVREAIETPGLAVRTGTVMQLGRQ